MKNSKTSDRAYISTTAQTHAPIFIFLTVFIDSMGIGIIVPVVPDLIQELTNLPLSKAALWGGYLSFVYALMQFLFSPTIGNLSDKYGRRPILLISMVALGLNYLIMGLASSLFLLFIGRIFSGIAGATFSTAYSFIADISPPEKKAQNFAIIGAAFGMGFVVGPVIGGVMGEIGTRAPFYAAAILSFLSCLYGFFVLPESLSKENRRSFDLKRANPIGAFKQIRKFPKVSWLFIAMFLFNLSHYVYPAVWNFYTKEMFKWTNTEIGLSLAFVGIGFAIVQGWLIRKILPIVGEVRTALIGFISSSIGLCGIAFSTQTWMVYSLIPLTALGAMITPAMTSLMSNQIPDDAQGELQGALSSISGMTLILSPVIMTQLFGYFSGNHAPFYFPGAPFLAASVLMLFALIPFKIGNRKVKI